MTVMDPNIKAKWLRRLRDPNAKQGKGTLRRADDSMCCLGVLCELAVDDGILPPPVRDAGVYVYRVPDDEDGTGEYEGLPPRKVLAWAGLPIDIRGVVVPRAVGTIENTLAELNDNGWTFAQIADIIEENF